MAVDGSGWRLIDVAGAWGGNRWLSGSGVGFGGAGHGSVVGLGGWGSLEVGAGTRWSSWPGPGLG